MRPVRRVHPSPRPAVRLLHRPAESVPARLTPHRPADLPIRSAERPPHEARPERCGDALSLAASLQRSQCKAVTFVSVPTNRTKGTAIVGRLPISLIHQSRFLPSACSISQATWATWLPVRPDRPPPMAIESTATGFLPSWPGTTAPELYVLRRTRRYCLGEEPGIVITRASFQGGLENRPLPRSI